MSDALLERLTYTPKHDQLAPIPWTRGLAPKPTGYTSSPNLPLPKADVVVVTYTSAEWMALADVFTPSYHKETWVKYSENWPTYDRQLTSRSPAKQAHCMGEYMVTQIGSKRVLVMHSQLHLATDAVSLPLRQFFGQIIEEVKPSLFVDTGTAGGIGSTIVEGDCIVGETLRFDCTGFLKDESYAQESFPCTFDASGIDFSLAETLMKANAPALRPEASRDPVVVRGDVLTCDSFLFDDSDNTFGLRTYDPAARCEEMDASVLGLTAKDLGSDMCPFISIRSASDPQMSSGIGNVTAQKQAASKIYLKYGYAAQVATLCAVWQVITQNS